MFDQIRTVAASRAAQKAFWGEGNFGDIDWNSIINRGFDLGSQFMQSYGGRTVGTQTYSTGGQIFAVQAKPSYDDSYQYTVPTGGVQTAQGGIAEDAAGSLMGFVGRNPIPIALGVLGVYLLMKDPPRRR